MPTINTEHPDIAMDDCIKDCLELVKENTEFLDDRRQLYWRVAYFCNAQFVPDLYQFSCTAGGDPRESASVFAKTTQIDKMASLHFKGSPDRRALFFKRLQQALSTSAYDLESARSGMTDGLFTHNTF